MLYVFFVSSRFTPVFFNKYKLAAPRTAFFWPAFVARILTPQSRKSGYERLLGCTSGLDGGPDQKTFYDDFEPKHQGNFHGLFGCIRSGVVELVGREPWCSRESRTAWQSCFCRKKLKMPNFWIRNSSFQWGIFIFSAVEKPTFFLGGGGVYIKNWLATDNPGA